jgi:hypothetical protein
VIAGSGVGVGVGVSSWLVVNYCWQAGQQRRRSLYLLLSKPNNKTLKFFRVLCL